MMDYIKVEINKREEKETDRKMMNEVIEKYDIKKMEKRYIYRRIKNRKGWINGAIIVKEEKNLSKYISINGRCSVYIYKVGN